MSIKLHSPDVIVFGGAFDPPHLGHSETAKILRKSFPKAPIIVVPSYSPVRSNGVEKTCEADFGDRVAMCVIAFEDVEFLEVSSAEESLPTPSYAIRTLQYFRETKPTSELGLVIGSDQLGNFSKWHSPREILEEASLIVLQRPEQTGMVRLEDLANVATLLGFKTSIDAKNHRVDIDAGFSMYLLSDIPPSVSSTSIRQCIREQKILPKGLVRAQVVEYIEDFKLYSVTTKKSGFTNESSNFSEDRS